MGEGQAGRLRLARDEYRPCHWGGLATVVETLKIMDKALS